MKAKTFLQALRRLGQQLPEWNDSFQDQDAQYGRIKKLYAQNGLELKMTCGACPEQYDVFKDGKPAGYLRLRHGEFRVDFPDVFGKTIYEAAPNGDGIFDAGERLLYLSRAMREILSELSTRQP